MSLKITGKRPTGRIRERIQKSSIYRNGSFQNQSPTPMKRDDISYWKMTREFMRKHPGTAPGNPIPSIKTDLNKLDNDEPVVVWFGHSSYFIRINSKNFLIDPVFSGNAAPVSFMVKAFPGADAYKAEDMPAIDYLILTHDHYDHLDFKTIRKLQGKTGRIICSLGISAHLEYWGVPGQKITELEWWQAVSLDNDMEMIAAPARHFSGRGVKRGQTLWSSYILKTPTHRLYLGGDSGYDVHFKEIGDKYGPFDLAILECGQYNTMWPLIHMMPEQTVQAAIDLQAKALMPVHWAKFKLGLHPWNEPVRRLIAEMERLKREDPTIQNSSDTLPAVVTPKIGEPVIINGGYCSTPWWEGLDS